VAFAWSNKDLSIGLIMLIIIIFLTVGAPLVTSYGPNEQDIANRLIPGFWSPNGSPGHFLGTDGLGRDLWTRIVYSFRVSLPIGILSVILILGIGVLVALISTTLGGWVDTILMRLTDVQMAFPIIVLVIVILSIRTPTPALMIVVFGLAAWPFYARLLRSIAISENKSDYIAAARAMGASNGRIMFKHLARNVVPPVIALAIIDVASVIVYEGVLSFMGVGIQPPTPSFGNIIADGKAYFREAWWLTIIPGLVIMFTVFAINLVGDAIHKLADPLSQKRN
jgi:peptide/nickel transport system permease protein